MIVANRSNVQMLFMVYAAVIVLCFITFRSWRAVVCKVLPLMLTSVLCEALMVGLNIGVDDALYILSVTLANLRQGASLSEAYYLALLSTGKGVVMIGITLGVAVLAWVLSPIKFQADVGFMFIWSMVGALVLVPALAHLLLKPTKPPELIAQ